MINNKNKKKISVILISLLMMFQMATPLIASSIYSFNVNAINENDLNYTDEELCFGCNGTYTAPVYTEIYVEKYHHASAAGNCIWETLRLYRCLWCTRILSYDILSVQHVSPNNCCWAE